jgi:UDP-N-acetylmuramoyl-tripeptide--D-alanyl-D-alanine ligase
MLDITFEEILVAVNGDIYVNSKNCTYNSVTIDTRTMHQNSIFIAVKGDNFNGNEFVLLASGKGASLCIVDEILFNKDELSSTTSIIIVKDTKRALMDLAMYYRSKLNVKVIGITGSTGKTSTKDLAYAALSKAFKVFKTQGNFNNEIGLPLMLFKIDNSYDVAILEMGMSNLGEIHRLSEVAKPDMAIITNIGTSHMENLKTRENILKAKMEITDFFTKDSVLLINGDNDLLNELHSKNYTLVKVGIDSKYDYNAEDIILNEKSISFKVYEKSSEAGALFNIEVPGIHNVLNALLAIACGRILNIDYEVLAKSITTLETTSMRLDITQGKKIRIIDDCYNASPDSMKAAINVLMNLKGGKKVAILGTMKELGENSYNAHREIGIYAKEHGVQLLITIGEYNNAYNEGFGNTGCHIAFSNVNEACEYILRTVGNNEDILVKASRSMKFEAIVKELKNKNC